MRVKALWMLRRKLLRGEKRIKFFSQRDQDDADKLKEFEVASGNGVEFGHVSFLSTTVPRIEQFFVKSFV